MTALDRSCSTTPNGLSLKPWQRGYKMLWGAGPAPWLCCVLPPIHGCRNSLLAACSFRQRPHADALSSAANTSTTLHCLEHRATGLRPTLNQPSTDAPHCPVLDKTRIFMHEWTKIAAGAGPEGVRVDHINDWFACMTADAVVKVRGALELPAALLNRIGLPQHMD